MIRKLSAAPLIYLNATQREWIEACNAAQLDYLGIRLESVGKETPFPRDTKSKEFQELKALIDDSRMQVLDIEVFAVNPDSKRDDWLPIFEAGEALGAQYLNLVGNDPDWARFEDTLGVLVEDARNHGIGTVIEAIAYWPFNSYSEAIRIARNLNCFVEMDGLHFVRTGAKLEDVLNNADLFPIAQFCDAKLTIPTFSPEEREALGAPQDASDQVVESRYQRLIAGEGDTPWVEIMQGLPETTVVAIEASNVLLTKELSVKEFVSRQAQQARDFLLEM